MVNLILKINIYTVAGILENIFKIQKTLQTNTRLELKLIQNKNIEKNILFKNVLMNYDCIFQTLKMTTSDHNIATKKKL